MSPIHARTVGMMTPCANPKTDADIAVKTGLAAKDRPVNDTVHIKGPMTISDL